MTNFMEEKMALLDMNGSEAGQYLIIINREDSNAAKNAIDRARGEFYELQSCKNHNDLLEDHIERALRSKEIEFAMP